MSEHYCKDCWNGKGDTCKFTGATHTTGIECPSFGTKEESEMNFRVRKTDDNSDGWTVADGDTYATTDNYVESAGTVSEYMERYRIKDRAQAALDLYLKKQGPESTFVGHPEGVLEIKPTNPKDALGVKKAPLSTLPTGPMYEVALAMLEGARKYGRHNYRVMGVKASVYYDAAMGHITAWWEGEDADPASGLHHLAKAMASLAVIRDSQMMNNWVDDRPPRYSDASELMRDHPAVNDILKRYPECVKPFTHIDRTAPVEGGY